MLVEPDSVPIVSVGIEAGIHQDHQALHHGITCGTFFGQCVHHFQRCLGAHGFIAVYVVAHPYNSQLVKLSITCTAVHTI